MRISSTLGVYFSSLFLLQQSHRVASFSVGTRCFASQQQRKQIENRQQFSSLLRLSDWADFSTLDDDDDLDDDDLYSAIDTTEYAVEDDSPATKAAVGAGLPAPEIAPHEQDVDPILVPAGSQLALSEETVLGILAACRNELGTLFGYTAENRGVGITGGVDYVDMDGPGIVIRLKGRFWHQRTTVLDRVSNYLMQRIPEIIEVTVEDPYQLTDAANAAAS